ncbi:hypothetical protein BY458DRAFT_495614 [Sporodiniella umbellata]|nr:hypothetical protein BY458DRAFT_495614 [Sporodiniella umbellata]
MFFKKDPNQQKIKYGKMLSSIKKDTDSYILAEVLIGPQYQNDYGQAICYPGSLIEGLVKIKVSVPISVERIKLTFKATERINYADLGWEKKNLSDGRLFSVSKLLLGRSTESQTSGCQMPVLEIRDYVFPFACQMPVVNFPPTFHNHSIAIEYAMFVTIERPKHASLLSKSVFLQFQPIIETISSKISQPFEQKIRITRQLDIWVSVPRLSYSVFESLLSIPVTLQFLPLKKYNTEVLQLELFVKRCYQIKYKTFSRDTEKSIVSHKLKEIPVDSTKRTFNLDLFNFGDTILPSLEYSNHLKIEYRLVIVAKVRYGLLNVKHTILDKPLSFGTLLPGIKSPRQLVSYSHSNLDERGNSLKPIFVSSEPMLEEDALPPYNSEEAPPFYYSELPRESYFTSNDQG